MTPFISGRADLRARLGPKQRPWLALPSERPLLSAALPCAWPTFVLTWPSGRDSCSSRRSAGQLPGLQKREGDQAQTGEVPDRRGLQALLCSESGCPRARVNPSHAAGSGGRVRAAVALGIPRIYLQAPGAAPRPYHSPASPPSGLPGFSLHAAAAHQLL